MLEKDEKYIQNTVLTIRRRLAALPIDLNGKKPTMEIGHFLVPSWRTQQTVRADDTYNILDASYNGTVTPGTIAMFVPKEEAVFITNAPMDIAFLLTITDFALAQIPALKEKIKQLESEKSKPINANNK